MAPWNGPNNCTVIARELHTKPSRTALRTEQLEGCVFAAASDCVFFWTAGRRVDDSVAASPFVWNTALSDTCAVDGDLSVMLYSPWHSRSHTPNVPAGRPACVTVGIRQPGVWDDKPCDSHACVLCEVDL